MSVFLKRLRKNRRSLAKQHFHFDASWRTVTNNGVTESAVHAFDLFIRLSNDSSMSQFNCVFWEVGRKRTSPEETHRDAAKTWAQTYKQEHRSYEAAMARKITKKIL